MTRQTLKGFTIFWGMVIAGVIMTVAGCEKAPGANGGGEKNTEIITLNPVEASPFNGGRFEGWGTSLCWWANRLGYSGELTAQAAKLFFSGEGLGLDIGRYNIGGGDDPAHRHITRSDSRVPGYAVGMDSSGGFIWDWTADQNQRNIVLAALKANPELYVEGFSNSPPWFLTVSGCSSGSEGAVSDNLRPDQYDTFARYIAETSRHFRDVFGIGFRSYSPMNEADTAYWGANSPKQEGCHFDSGESQSRMILATRKALDGAGLADILVAGLDETSIDQMIVNLDKLTEEAKAALGRIDTHTYGGSKRAELKAKALSMGKDLWMSEVDGGWQAGTNAENMAAGLGLAERIILDMNGMQPSAWVLWNIVDFHKDSNFSDPGGNRSEAERQLRQDGGIWGLGMADHDEGTIFLTQKYYVFGQFTRYIHPGDTIIASSNKTLAAYNRDSGGIKIVAINTEGAAKSLAFDLGAFERTGSRAAVIRTSGSYADGEHWTPVGSVKVKDKKFSFDLPANSVTTFVIER